MKSGVFTLPYGSGQTHRKQVNLCKLLWLGAFQVKLKLDTPGKPQTDASIGIGI